MNHREAPSTNDGGVLFFEQVQQYRKFHAEKKEKEDFIRNSSLVSFLITSKYSSQEAPAVLTSKRVDKKKKKKMTTFEQFRGDECQVLTRREPGSWFQSSFQ